MAEELAIEERDGDLWDENEYDEYDYEELDDYGGPESEVYYNLRLWLKRDALSTSPKLATPSHNDNTTTEDATDNLELSPEQIKILKKAQVVIKHTKLTLFGMLQTESCVLERLVDDTSADLPNKSDEMTILTAEAPLTDSEPTMSAANWKPTNKNFFEGMVRKSLEIELIKMRRHESGRVAPALKARKAGRGRGIGEGRMPKREQVGRSNSVDVNRPKHPPARRLTQPDLTYANAHCVSIISSKGHTGVMDIVPSLLNFHPINIVTFRSKENDQSLSPHGAQLPNYQQFLQSSFMSLISLKDCLSSPSQPLEAGKDTLSVQYKDDECTPLHCVVSPEPLQEGVTLRSVFGNSLDSLAERCYNECINPLEQLDIIREEIKRHGIIAHIPTQWLLFQYALEIFRDTYDSIIEFTHCVELSTMFYMEESQVKEALIYLHNMSIFLYFPDVLPGLVFLRPQPVIEKLAQLMKTCKSLMKTKREAKRTGVFQSSVLKKLEFDGFQLEEGHVEYLMSRIFVIAKLPENDEFFFPGVLDFATPSELPKYDNIEPLVIALKNDHVFPSSLFLALVFKLLSHDLFSINVTGKTTQYRNAISLRCSDTLGGAVALINSGHYLEVYYSGLTENCFQIRTIIEEEIPKIVNENKWRQSLKNVKYCFFCSIKKHENEAKHLCELNKNFNAITCCDFDSVVGTTLEELGKKKEWATNKIVRRSGVPDIQKVYNILCSEPGPIQNKWVDLANALGVRSELIDAPPNATMAAMLRKVLDRWLDKSSKEERTWNVLIEAIRRNYVSPAKADEIEKEMHFD